MQLIWTAPKKSPQVVHLVLQYRTNVSQIIKTWSPGLQ